MPPSILRLRSLKTNGLLDDEIVIEALKTRGLQQLQLTGLPDVWLKDVREKIRTLASSLTAWGPLDRILIHLLPAGIEKCGAHLELPIALAAMGVLQNDLGSRAHQIFEQNFFVGALNLRGDILPTPETLAWEELGTPNIVGPSRYLNITELWGDLLEGNLKAKERNPALVAPSPAAAKFWQPQDRRSEQMWMWLSYLAQLPVLLLGPPGVGKTYLAKWSEQLLDFRDRAEESTVRRIWSLAGLPTPAKPPAIFPLPRSHFSEFAGLQRQGVLRPGYFALSHGGILVLDEFCEFSRDCREILRNVLDEKRFQQNTKSGQVTWPANFFLVLTSNPCPCGRYLPGNASQCHCSRSALLAYQSRISGPLFDRMGIRLFLHNEASDMSFPEECLQLPTHLEQVRDAQRLIKDAVPGLMETSLELIRHNPQLLDLSKREQSNKAKILSVLRALQTQIEPSFLLSLVEGQCRLEKKIQKSLHAGGNECFPLSNVSDATG